MTTSADDETTIPGLGFRSKADLVTDYLRAEIQAGRPRPGERLVVNQVAERLGVSKVPVREAVTRLVGEGLLVHRPNIGPLVPGFTAHEVRETALMRVAMESAALPTALARHSPESVEALRALLDEMRTVTDEAFPALNVRFHAAVLEPTPYREMYQSAHALLARAQRYAFVHTLAGYRSQAHEEHAGIVEAIGDGDLDALQARNRDHILSAAEQLAGLVDAAEQQADPGTT